MSTEENKAKADEFIAKYNELCEEYGMEIEAYYQPLLRVIKKEEKEEEEK